MKAHYGLTEADLAEIPASLFFKNVPASVTNGKEAIDLFKICLHDKIAYEYCSC